MTIYLYTSYADQEMILLSVHLSENIPSDRSYFIYNNFIYVFILSTLLKFFMQYLDKYRQCHLARKI